MAGVRDLTNPEQRAAVPAGASVVISDRGDRITVTISNGTDTTVREYGDAARDCERRAHFAAVLAVVSLFPPANSEPEPVQAAPPPAPPPRPPPALEAASIAAAPRLPHVRVELGGVAEFSTPISDSVRAFSPAALLGVALGRGKLQLTLTTQYAPPIDVDYTGAHAGRAELQRFDVGVGARLSLWHRGVDVAAELGAVASRARARGVDTERPEQDTAFDVGGRLGLHVAAAEPWLVTPFLGLSATVFPAAAKLAQLPAGTVGHLPYCWLGVSTGLELSL